MTPAIRARDLAERVFWSFVSGFLGSFLASPLVLQVIEEVAGVELSVTVLGSLAISATFAGLTAAANVVLVIARWRLSVLPDPGAGLPGLTTNDDGGMTTAVFLVIVFAVVAVALIIAG